MTTEKKIAANRWNAKRSTGPRTRSGQAKASRNALRHGLAVSIASDPALSGEVERLARMIGGDDIERLPCARIAAEAKIELLRIRRAKTQYLEESRAFGGSNDIQAVAAGLLGLIKIDRYERRAFSRLKKALRDLSSF
jgi:hypothetical protein